MRVRRAAGPSRRTPLGRGSGARPSSGHYRRRPHPSRLGREALELPARALLAVAEAVVEAALPLQPELDPVGDEAVAAPVLGALDLAAGEALLGLLEPLL